MTLLGIICSVLLIAPYTVTEANLDEVRSAFMEAAQDADLRMSLVESLEQNDQLDPVFQKAYLGASLALLAETAATPWGKYSYFSRGTELLDESIHLRPNVAEFRHLRFMIQLKSPAFLGYQDALSEDYDAIQNALRVHQNKALWMEHFRSFEHRHLALIHQKLTH